MKQRRRRVIPLREARLPLRATGLDRSGLLVRLEDARGIPFFITRSQMERLIWKGEHHGCL